MSAPEGYKKLPAGVRCRCPNSWTEGESIYCCKGPDIIEDPFPHMKDSTITAQEIDAMTVACVNDIYTASIGNPPAWRWGSMEQIVKKHLLLAMNKKEQ